MSSQAFSTISSLFIILLALPTYYFLARWLGRSQAVRIIFILSIYALAVETVALATGYPYGEFIYTDKIGYKLFGITPWTVPFAWVPLLIGAFTIVAQRLEKTLYRIFATAFVLVLVDMIIDPAAVLLGFWQYGIYGKYYDVPFSNFVGWSITGSVGALIFWYLLKNKKVKTPPRTLIVSLFLTSLVWTTACIYLKELKYAAILGAIYTVWLFYNLFPQINVRSVRNVLKLPHS